MAGPLEMELVIKPRDLFTAVSLRLLTLLRPAGRSSIWRRIGVAAAGATRPAWRIADRTRRILGATLVRFIASDAFDDLHAYGGLLLVGVGLWLLAPSAGLVAVGLVLFAMSGYVGTIRRRL
mgnify:CR=1 FL=1